VSARRGSVALPKGRRINGSEIKLAELQCNIATVPPPCSASKY
jgi:hypothetical protein